MYLYKQLKTFDKDIGFVLVDGKEISYNTYSHSGLNAFTYRQTYYHICGKYQGYGYIIMPFSDKDFNEFK